MTGARLGYEVESGEMVRVAADAMNCHILVTGRTGSGKTVAVQQIAGQLAEDGACTVILNYNQAHSSMEKEGTLWISVRRDGFPMSLLSGDGGMSGTESREEAVRHVINILSSINRLSGNQRRIIRSAIMQMESGHGNSGNDFGEILRQIQDIGERNKKLEDAAVAIEEKYYEVFHMTRIRVQEVAVPGKTVVIDLSEYDDSDTQKMLAGLAMVLLWQRARKEGMKSRFPVYLVLDEFQNLDCRKNSVMEKILREGRKFHMHLILATQTLSTIPAEIQPVLENPATRLYFPLPEKDRKKLARSLPYTAEQSERLLSGMEQGTCLAVGKFQIRDHVFNGPVTLTFWRHPERMQRRL